MSKDNRLALRLVLGVLPIDTEAVSEALVAAKNDASRTVWSELARRGGNVGFIFTIVGVGGFLLLMGIDGQINGLPLVDVSDRIEIGVYVVLGVFTLRFLARLFPNVNEAVSPFSDGERSALVILAEFVFGLSTLLLLTLIYLNSRGLDLFAITFFGMAITGFIVLGLSLTLSGTLSLIQLVSEKLRLLLN